jgi:hypothetical protein
LKKGLANSLPVMTGQARPGFPPGGRQNLEEEKLEKTTRRQLPRRDRPGLTSLQEEDKILKKKN